MKTVNVNLYEFKELLPVAQKAALSELSDINTDFSWWEDNYYDANRVNLKITSFDIDAGKIEAHFMGSPINTANLILKEHGEECKTRKITESFLKEWEEAGKSQPEKDEVNYKYWRDLLQEYLHLIKSDYEYRTTEAAIIETIEANEYDFSIDGHLWNWKLTEPHTVTAEDTTKKD